MELSNEQYAQMVNWMERQQRRVAELEAQNRDLRQQLEELRRGVGVSLVIQGRALPVAVLPAPAPTSPIAASPAPVSVPPHQRAPLPVAPGAPLTPAASGTAAHPSFPPFSAPLRPQAQPRAAAPSMPTPAPAPAPDSAWLTGQMRAVHAPAQRTAGARVARQQAASQEMTPTWLREEAPLSGPVVPPVPSSSSWPSTPGGAAQRPRTLASATGKQPAVRPRRPTVPRLEPEHLPSLAQMTGRHPAARVPVRSAGERSPYSDSFVLD